MSLTDLIRQDLEPYLESLYDSLFGNVTINTDKKSQRIYDGIFESLRGRDMDKNTENTITLILAGLARAAGGELVLSESDMGEIGDQLHIDVNQKAGLITITLLPDYVKVGVEEDPKKQEFTVKWNKSGVATTTFEPATFDFQVVDPFGSGSTVESVMLYDDRPDKTWTATLAFDEVK